MSRFLQKTEEAPLNPLALMRRFTEDFDRAFGQHFGFSALPEFDPRIWTPAIEVGERDNRFFVRVELPGLTKEDVKVQVAHDQLTIEGERRLEKDEKGGGWYRCERSYGKFLRRVEIPDHVKAEEAVATFKDGVLDIQMPAIPVPARTARTLEIK